MKHQGRTQGDGVSVDDKFTPPFALAPVEIIRKKLGRFIPESVDYLVEWATGERAWVIEWAVHDPGWQPKTGQACACGEAAVLYLPRGVQV